ncbi:lytic transglycosylase domain-containing protein [Sandaracinobacter neustonicus]|uniref:Lytic transglycosylase domain-containing protein n=1 Tax=Sandaracinobacter neustonicus TaxID=1715348 RepID=A0A501XEP3_9SPHN|nr:transglycosylase SLT domain-containing protein [Sandaracinobacter neustonicus]TPE59061.1 lytic transglycosylase domain-containing protein [Sandaracinobacter neustonicus]
MSASPLSGSVSGSGSSSAAAAVLPALVEAAQRTGVDFSALYHTARLESGFNPDAKARTSSATGLFQFIDSSWLNVLAKHGARHGLSAASKADALALRNDPRAASLMAAEHMADNAELLESRLGREAGPVDLYLAHFLGAGGAARFLEALSASPDQSAAALMPSAARANPSIFFQDGQPRSLAEVHALFSQRLGVESAPVAVAATAGTVETAAALPETPLRAAEAARLAYLLLADLGV